MPDTRINDRALSPVGTITAVHGPVVVVACETLPPLHRALCTRLGDETYLFEVHQHLDERHIRAITLHRPSGLRRGMAVNDMLHMTYGRSRQRFGINS